MSQQLIWIHWYTFFFLGACFYSQLFYRKFCKKELQLGGNSYNGRKLLIFFVY